MTGRALALPLALALAVLLAGCGSGPGPEPEDPTEHFFWSLDRAWGPESPETLEKYLEVREALAPIYRQYEEGIQQWALRELGTRPTFGPSLLGMLRMRRERDRLLQEKGLSLPDWERLTILVYGRWLRAVRPDPPPEKRLVRVLGELEVGLARHLRNNPPEDPRERARLRERLAAVRHQRRCLAPFGEMDKAAVLARIDPATRKWLEDHRERIEAVDFRLLDTAPPPRKKSAPPQRGPGRAAAGDLPALRAGGERC